MSFVGEDLHLKTISVSLAVKEGEHRKIATRMRSLCAEPEQIRASFQQF